MAWHIPQGGHRKEERKKPQGKNTTACPIPQGGHKKIRKKLQKYGPMPNVMAALPNIGGVSVQRRKVWLTPTTTVPCSNAAKTRNPLKFKGVPKLANRSQPLVGQSSPYGAQMAHFWRFFGSRISSEPRAVHFRHAFYIHTNATPCVEVWQTSNL